MSRHSRRCHQRLPKGAPFPREATSFDRLLWKLQSMTEQEKNDLDAQSFEERAAWLKEAVNFQP